MKEILGDSVLILGYGREGKSTHRYVLEHYPKKRIGIADQQKVEPIANLPAELHIGKDYLESVCHYDVIIRSPGVSSRLPKLQECLELGKKVTTATNIFFSECPGMIIGVTGTKGKSTTSSLTANILKEKYCDVRLVGNIGQPALDYLPGSNSRTIFVAELSSFQLEDIHYSPHIVIILAIVPEHFDRYRNFSQYVKAKGQILNHQTTKDIVIFNPSHKIVNELVLNGLAKKYRFSLKPKKDVNCYLNKEDIFIQKEGKKPLFVLDRSEIPLLGEGNIENTLAAILVGAILNIPLSKIRKAIAEFESLEHRLEFVGEYHGIKFYNDSLATIPEATIHALKAIGNDVETLIAGGYDRGLDFSKLGEFLGKRRLRSLILFPPTGKRIWEALCNAAPKEPRPQKYDVSSMKEAVDIAYQTTSPGKICLLSPASASFGLFRDYQQRGDLFKKYIEEFVKQS